MVGVVAQPHVPGRHRRQALDHGPRRAIERERVGLRVGGRLDRRATPVVTSSLLRDDVDFSGTISDHRHLISDRTHPAHCTQRATRWTLHPTPFTPHCQLQYKKDGPSDVMPEGPRFVRNTLVAHGSDRVGLHTFRPHTALGDGASRPMRWCRPRPHAHIEYELARWWGLGPTDPGRKMRTGVRIPILLNFRKHRCILSNEHRLQSQTICEK